MSMRNALAAAALVAAAALAAAGQSWIPEEVRATVNEGARLYRAGRFAEAQALFEQALRAAPSNETLALFVARAVQQQYKPGVQTPENRAKGEEAVAAYERVLALDPLDDDAYKAVVFLHGQMRNEDKVRELLTLRAHDPSLPAGQRAEAFVILASKQWQCSYDITEQKENKETQTRTEADKLTVVVRYKKPADQADFDRARQCVAEGLKLAEQAVNLDQNNPNSWSYRANLLREAAKLAEMEGDAEAHADYSVQYERALETHRRLAEELVRQEEARPRTEPHPPEP